MTQNKEDLKNKIMYRASYRGAKEIDILLISFVKKYIDSLKNEDLVDLCNFLILTMKIFSIFIEELKQT